MDLLDKMATYVRVIESGSFSAAAKQLRISAAAVSRQIATLEAELRAPLILRSTRRMTITSGGRHYYDACRRILREVEEAQAVGRSNTLEGQLSISAPVTFGLTHVVPHARELMMKHPGLRVDLRLEDRLVDLAFEDVDVAIRVGGAIPESTDLIAHRLLSFSRVLVASPAYLSRKGEPKTPEALATHDALAYGSDNWTLISAEREARVRVNVTFRCNAVQAVRELAVGGAGIALVPDWIVLEPIQRRALRVILPAWQGEPVTVSAIHRTDQRGAPRVRALIEHLREAYAPRPARDEPRPATPSRRPKPSRRP